MEVDCNKARDTFVEKIEFKKDPFNYSGHVCACGFDGAGKIDIRHCECETFTDGRKSRFCYLLVEAWTAVYIDIVSVWGSLEVNVGLLGVADKISGLFCLIQGVAKADLIREIWAWIKGDKLGCMSQVGRGQYGGEIWARIKGGKLGFMV